MTISKGLTATIYDIQVERQTKAGPELIREVTKTMTGFGRDLRPLGNGREATDTQALLARLARLEQEQGEMAKKISRILELLEMLD